MDKAEPTATSSALALPPIDKMEHFAVSAALTVAGCSLAGLLARDRLSRSLAGIGIGLGAGVAKEAADSVTPDGIGSKGDLAWDAAGCLAGLALFHVINTRGRRKLEREQAARELALGVVELRRLGR